ncbi:MAG: sigma 54-interacting transcriptional regulator [Planctomycetota bacterium]|nr:sigma 54-interacting transcriptional regulator [Planctomycetota bacterium]MDA1165450.1 sigma 54-interacting transcriptional regulator [Planctomycetota bacterium]
MTDRPQTLGELKASGYSPMGVKDEMRRNLIQKLKAGETLFHGIVGYDETVIPQIVNAILSKHDMLFLGLRGQGKTRMLRMLTEFLDDSIPVIAGSEINDDPLSPLSKFARDRVAAEGDKCPINWIGRCERYYEKLATPDVTIADLIGEVDLIKHAEGRHLASEDVMHFGLIPRSHRGIFCMNELPDLSPKIQVGLFNVLEERDIQIRGFTIRLPLDLCLVFSANPEDYTNRGRIVTPLKDRIGSVISTHYPTTREIGVRITDDNAWTSRDSEVSVFVPGFIRSILEETSRLARTSPHVNRASGVSVRMSIANLENSISNAEKRGLLLEESRVVVRVSDLAHIASSSRGKMELAMSDEPGEEDRLVGRLLAEAVKTIFDESFTPKQFRSLVEYFDMGDAVVMGDGRLNSELHSTLQSLPGIGAELTALSSLVEPDLPDESLRPALEVAVAGFILDGLHHHNRLNRRTTESGSSYGL